MSTFNGVRVASANARDGVNTRTKVNWAQAVKQPVQKTICRSDMIIGLGQLAANQSYDGRQAWGDVMTDNLPKAEKAPSRWAKAYSDYDLWKDMVDEPWKYGVDMLTWPELNDKLMAGDQSARCRAHWFDREEVERAKLACEQAPWRKAFKPIAAAAAAKCMTRWINRDIKALIAKIKNAVVTIQAAVRGYQARCKDVHQDCCMCLSHRISPLKTAVGYMCRDCGADGPYVDQVENDPWNWFRSDYVEVCA